MGLIRKGLCRQARAAVAARKQEPMMAGGDRRRGCRVGRVEVEESEAA